MLFHYSFYVGHDDVDGIVFRQVVHRKHKLVVAGVVTRLVAVPLDIGLAPGIQLVDDVNGMLGGHVLALDDALDAMAHRSLNKHVQVIGPVAEYQECAPARHNTRLLRCQTLQNLAFRIKHRRCCGGILRCRAACKGMVEPVELVPPRFFLVVGFQAFYLGERQTVFLGQALYQRLVVVLHAQSLGQLASYRAATTANLAINRDDKFLVLLHCR